MIEEPDDDIKDKMRNLQRARLWDALRQMDEEDLERGLGLNKGDRVRIKGKKNHHFQGVVDEVGYYRLRVINYGDFGELHMWSPADMWEKF